MLTCMLIHLLIFVPAFPLGRFTGPAALGGLVIPQDQQQFLIVLLAPHEDRTKQGQRCCHSTWSFDEFGPLCCGCSVDCSLKD